MVPLKSFSLLLGEQMLRLNNYSHKDSQPTPLFLDEANHRVISHTSSTQKQVIQLDKVLMYTYELEDPVVSQ